jgi:transposase-like protein
MLTRMGELTLEVPQVRSGDFYPSALEKGNRTDQAVNLALAEMSGKGHRVHEQAGGHAGTCDALFQTSIRRLRSIGYLRAWLISRG